MAVSTQDGMLRSIETWRLMRAFHRIHNREVRQAVIEFAEQAARSCLSINNEQPRSFAKKPTPSVAKSTPKYGSSP